ncbi:uncharacterized protein Dwil_GK21769 [Drosophila willistoni]|uniref:sodium channel protein Nach n=1 Tax=Drosophila willistoni TaxID=7260 RepID=UPI0007327E0C|nr:sodium channel protein Nach [Drosophila willistoni]EDW74133.2 uncharacterized protein Dwil_GK21769 [Drosophila willistoni]
MEHQSKKSNEENTTVDWWSEFAKESAVHGMPYLARKDFHWIERIFWLAMIIAAAYYAISSCYSQWERYRDNPIVYEYEYLYALKNFTFIGVTFCTHYESEDQVSEVIKDTWSLDVNDSESLKVAYYRQFLYTLNRLRYTNLETLKDYKNDESLNNLSYVNILLKLQHNVLPLNEIAPTITAPIITEMGLCQTTGQLNRYSNPFGKVQTLNVTPMRHCGFFNECQLKHIPFNSIQTELYLYIHDVNEVALPNDRQTVTFNAGDVSSYILKLLLTSISAENEVRNLPVAYRKCRYHDENNLQYFNPYHPSLCRLECRINWALKLCHCRPFFYTLPQEAPVCNVTGMLCLHEKKWLEKPCQCFPLCRQTTYNIVEEFEQSGGGQKYVGEQFERTVILKLELPKMGMKRRVVFSADQLIMSFGGAIGLFLGASFMTIYGLIYLFLYFIYVKCKSKQKFKRHQRKQI